MGSKFRGILRYEQGIPTMSHKTRSDGKRRRGMMAAVETYSSGNVLGKDRQPGKRVTRCHHGIVQVVCNRHKKSGTHNGFRIFLPCADRSIDP